MSSVPPSLLEQLRGVPAFSGLSDDDLARVAEAGTVERFAPGAVLMNEGDPAERAYVLLSGRVRIARQGREVTDRGPGDLLGEVALIDSSPRSATARAVAPVTVLALERYRFDALVSRPEIAKSILLALSSKLRKGDLLIRQAMEDLQQLQSLKDDLFSMIVHDLRNPLQSLKGSLPLLRETATDPELLDLVARSAQYMESLLEGVLDVRLLEEGELPLAIEPLDLAGLIRDVAAAMEQTGAAKRVTIQASAPSGGMAIAVDRKLIRRALENLVSNAIKYAPTETAVHVVLHDEGQSAVVIVADRGPGVPPELQGALFRKFGSVEVKRGGARRGYGLGLHLVNLVALAHGGSVSIQEREGGGSAFVLRLPCSALPALA